MLTKNEITALNLSPTKKDFVQVWNELLEVAGRLSERWDPTSTNESDPGIVILKALTGIADKLNYNIDKNTLEAFMPTAAQEDSMRKLCDMLGYNMKYYRSAETTVTFKYYNAEPSEDELTTMQTGLYIPKFTVITNSDKDINYFTTNQTPYYISKVTPRIDAVPCMEGQLVKCESTFDNNVITASQISDNNRFYLPEYRIAENGIFVYNATADQEDGDSWSKVDNLNIQQRGTRVFKFGYDSYEGRPYIEFPEDWGSLINDGLFIYYARTSGANGNVSVRTLTQFELPSTEGWDKVSAESFSVENSFSATTGADIETIGQAYNNFKKTIGTFETLVTCRDYMNKICTMVDEYTGKYIVSNALVTDIRNDLNRAVVICSCDDAGIFYKETSLTQDTVKSEEVITQQEDENTVLICSEANKPVYSDTGTGIYNDATGLQISTNWYLGHEPKASGSQDAFPLYDVVKSDTTNFVFNTKAPGEVLSEYENGEPSDNWLILQDGHLFETKFKIERIESATKTITQKITKTIAEASTPAIDHFDLVLYPFKSYSQIHNNIKDIQNVYDASFKYSQSGFNAVENILSKSGPTVKTIAHNIIAPRAHDITSINNYLRLNAIISTTSKITTEESKLLIHKIKIALANAFNMHELDFGEEIPFDSIIDVIKEADTRISVVSLAEPALYTTFSVFEGLDGLRNPIIKEYAVASNRWLPESYADSTNRFEYSDNTYTFDTKEAREIYNKLVVRNILAGRVPLFKYNTTFKTSFSDAPYRITVEINAADIPSAIKLEPTNEAPFIIRTYNGVTYTGQLINGEAKYTKTYVPDDYINNIITKDPADDNNITKIVTSCKIKPTSDTPSQISDVQLVDGELIKFRAPNFITKKTFPAYVNYHLKLNHAIKGAEIAEAHDLYSLISTDKKREQVLSYFKANYAKAENPIVQTFKLVQRVRKRDTNVNSYDDLNIDKSYLVNNIPSQEPLDIPGKIAEILNKSGFVKLINNDAEVAWSPLDGESAPENANPPEMKPLFKDSDSRFIDKKETFENIASTVNTYLKDSFNSNELPTTCSWTISYSFEYVPLDSFTLKAWQDFCGSDTAKEVFEYAPEFDNYNALWYSSEGAYTQGRYVCSSGNKLLPLAPSTFTSITQDVLKSVFVAKNLGKDAEVSFISNNEEYKLRAGEYLLIEYTPSSTNEDGIAEAQSSVQEVYEEGTIIRPSGFVEGLKDSEEQYNVGKSSYKSVTFMLTSGAIEAQMYSLGASEQIELRDPACVMLDKNALPDSSTIYVYKNFNGCKELESTNSADSNGKRSYTLKDGEYIFYTDQNKSELAYYSSGTEVTLTGNLIIPEFDIIDLALIFDNGIQEIPWSRLYISGGDSISFKEFQYITLGAGDKLDTLTFAPGTEEFCLDADWRYCADVTYTPFGETKSIPLPKINVSAEGSTGNGWEACSILNLNVSPSKAQTLRKTQTVETSITLFKENSSGVNSDTEPLITIEPPYVSDNVVNTPPISIKANLPCQSYDSTVKLSDVYLNLNEANSFELKVFTEQAPAIIKMQKTQSAQSDCLLPVLPEDASEENKAWLDILEWPAETKDQIINKIYGDLWTQIDLTKFSDTIDYENAIRLPVCLLPNTYGIFSVYVNYSDVGADNSTWIALPAGADINDITLLSPAKEAIKVPEDTENPDAGELIKLVLEPGLNCIKVNKTVDLFIKTSAKHGILMFDELRLVDCQPIEYVENGKIIKQETQGLNLSQLGYLSVTDIAAPNVFDAQIRRKLKETATTEALTTIADMELTNTNDLNVLVEELLETKPRLQTLLNFFTNANKEIRNLNTANTDYDKIASLLIKYKELYEDIATETALQDVLANHTDINALDKQLIELLDTLKNSDVIKQELLDALDELEQTVKNNIGIFERNELSKGDILDDFEASADSSDLQLINDIKLISLREINAEYSSKLTALGSVVQQVTDDTAKNNLLIILEELNLIKHIELVAQITQLITTSKESLDNVLEQAVNIASTYEVKYGELYGTLVSLRSKLGTMSIEELFSKIELITNSDMANNTKYHELTSHINTLKQLLDSEAPGKYTTLVTTLNDLLITVQAKINAGDTTVDSTILATLNEMHDDVYDVYVINILATLTKLNDTLTTLSEYESKIDELADSNNQAIKAILDNITAYSSARTAKIEAVDIFNSSDNFSLKEAYLSLPYGVIAVLAVWPSYMKRDFIIGVDKLYKDVRELINGSSVLDSFELDRVFYASGSTTELRKTLVTIANIAAFQQLFEQAKNQVDTNRQNLSRKEFINQIGMLTTNSELQTVISGISTDDDKLTVIRKIIAELKDNPDVTERQKLIKTLEAAVNDALKIDTQLFEVCAKLLCPSILLFNKALPEAATEETFYQNLAKYVTAQVTDEYDGILAIIDPSVDNFVWNVLDKFDNIHSYFQYLHNVVDGLLVAVTNNDIGSFNYWSAFDNTGEFDATSVFTAEYVEQLLSIKLALDTKVQLEQAKSGKLFKILKDNKLVIAWQDPELNWRDLSGNYYQRYINNTWVPFSKWPSRDATNSTIWTNNNGFWCTDSGELVNVTLKREGAANGTWKDTNGVEVNVYEDLNIDNADLLAILNALFTEVNELGKFNAILPEAKTTYSIWCLEKQLLDEIRAIDTKHEFYYNIPIESHMAINFNEGDSELNTLMNPAVNYDINNINNNFVISKLDINYITTGFQIAKSSKLN